MGKVFEWLSRQSGSLILMLVGILCIILSIFEFVDASKLQINPRNPAFYLGMTVGFLIFLTGIALLVKEEGIGALVLMNKTKKISDGFSANIYNSEARIVFGRIEKIAIKEEFPDSKCLIVLPANEYFDDECIEDIHTSLGSYVNAKFQNSKMAIRQKIKSRREALQGVSTETKEVGVEALSYGSGSGLLIEDLPGSTDLMLLVAAATKRAKIGLRSDISIIYKCLECAVGYANDKRASKIIVPLLGSGEGGPPPVKYLSPSCYFR